MPRIMPLRPENADENLPPTFYLKFSQEEFPAFLANPTAVIKYFGQNVKNLTVTVKDHVWDAGNQEWITDQSDARLAVDGGLPPASQWEWWCGYQDEMCVCERVLVP
ncbi:hypothetical protein ACIGNX_22180 [Actinosynnema sp. NPDC053489]|uniref:hypothetical protein n=1 Tax=Actinosynnema sp. NPDC053489 TaxID=3363916 RepID=UPI0037C687FF